jgi:hypothetical protein
MIRALSGALLLIAVVLVVLLPSHVRTWEHLGPHIVAVALELAIGMALIEGLLHHVRQGEAQRDRAREAWRILGQTLMDIRSMYMAAIAAIDRPHGPEATAQLAEIRTPIRRLTDELGTKRDRFAAVLGVKVVTWLDELHPAVASLADLLNQEHVPRLALYERLSDVGRAMFSVMVLFETDAGELNKWMRAWQYSGQLRQVVRESKRH